LFAAAFASLFAAAMVVAADKPADSKDKSPTTKPATQAAFVNKFCAVEGGDHTVDPDVFVMYKGQKVGFCCKDCIEEFNASPDEYITKMKKRNDYASSTAKQSDSKTK
jgi:hypothetical protein